MSEALAIQQQQQGTLSLSTKDTFEHVQRVAKLLAESQLIPTTFQKNIPNVVIAMEMAQRIGCSALMVMQNMDIIHGRPSWKSVFNIASVNSSGKFTPLRFTYTGTPNTDDWSCYAHAKSREDGETCKGITVSIAIAKAEGWFGKSGSKWKTMPELMLMYRAATWWTRQYSPEILMGMGTEDEAIDVNATTVTATIPDEPVAEKAGKGVRGMRQAERVETPDKTAAEARATAEPKVEPATQPVVDVPAEKAPQTTPVTPATPEPQPPVAPPAAPEPEQKTSTVEAELDEAPAPTTLRMEIVDVVETQAKKAGGVVGPVCRVTLKGDFQGTAYFDGEQAKLPGNGAVIDAVLTEQKLKGNAVKILGAFTVVG